MGYLRNHTGESVSGRGALRAIAVWFPATLFPEVDSDMGQDAKVAQSDKMARKGAMISRMVGKALGIDPRPALEASPITVLAAVPPEAALPPYLNVAGEDDTTVSRRQSHRMATALGQRASPPQVDFTLFPNSGHGSGPFRGEAVGHLVGFLSAHLTA